MLIIALLFIVLSGNARATVIEANTPIFRKIKNQAGVNTTVVFGFCVKSFAACRRFHDVLSEIDERYGPQGWVLGVKVTVVSVEAAAKAMSVMDQLHIQYFPTIIVLKNGAESRWENTKGAKLESVLNFVEKIILTEAEVPKTDGTQMEDMGEASYARILARNRTVAVMWYDETTASAPKHLEIWNALHKQFGDIYTFAIAKNSQYADHASTVGVNPKSLPAFLVLNANEFQNENLHGGTVNYPSSGDVSIDALALFLDTAHKEPPTHKGGADLSFSQPIPSDALDPSDGFLKAVASTLEGMVFDATMRMTFVMYAPEEGCAKCASAILSIQKLRDRIPDNMRDSISFVKFDPTKNAYTRPNGHFNPTFIFPEFAIRNGTTIMAIDPRLGFESVLDDIVKNFIPLEPAAMKTGHHMQEWKHPKDMLSPHHHHTSPHDCHSGHEVQYIVNRIDETEREIRTLYRFVYGKPEPEGFIL